MALIWLVLLPLLLVMALAEAAQAHAVVVGTEPADGAVTDNRPQDVVVRFSEPVSVIAAQVLGPDGQDILGPNAARGEEGGLRIDLPTSLTEGTFTVSYRVVSLDGHPIGGSLVFSVGQVSGNASGAQPPNHASAWRWGLVTSWTVFYLALLGAAGGVLFMGLVRPGEPSIGPTRRIVAVSAGLGVLAAMAAVGVEGGLLLNGSLGSLMELRTWQVGANSTFGRAAYCAVSGLLLILLGVTRPSSGVMALLRAAGVLLALGSFALTGHVVTAGPWWLTWPLLLVHVGIVAFWIGSLLPLHRALSTSAEHVGPLVGRFSRLAVILVPVLLLAGVLIAVVQVGRVEAVLTTEYGRVLLVKVALVSGIMLLAALNRLWLTPTLVRGDAGASSWLRLSILTEMGLVIAILAATATLGTTPPPRALVSDALLDASDLHAHGEHGSMHGEQVLSLTGQGFEATVTLTPGQIGANMAMISLQDSEGQPLDVPEVSLRLSNPGRGVAPLERPAERVDLGMWHAADLVLGVAGEWEVELDVLVSDFERQTLRAPLILE